MRYAVCNFSVLAAWGLYDCLAEQGVKGGNISVGRPEVGWKSQPGEAMLFFLSSLHFLLLPWSLLGIDDHFSPSCFIVFLGEISHDFISVTVCVLGGKNCISNSSSLLRKQNSKGTDLLLMLGRMHALVFYVNWGLLHGDNFSVVNCLDFHLNPSLM